MRKWIELPYTEKIRVGDCWERYAEKCNHSMHIDADHWTVGRYYGVLKVECGVGNWICFRVESGGRLPLNPVFSSPVPIP